MVTVYSKNMLNGGVTEKVEGKIDEKSNYCLLKFVKEHEPFQNTRMNDAIRLYTFDNEIFNR